MEMSAGSGSHLIATLLHATAVGGGSGSSVLLRSSAILATILALPGSAHHHPCHCSILGLVLAVLLFDIIVDPVIYLVMATTARSGDRGTRDCTGSGTPHAST
ncbi:hypothetical protein PS723_05176 [Pseudomonas fluorescens]|uniref:Uncharacterized protein n=1 Tax=Pseudomonas fluorescens TaxID=294 RepID=A0A5E7F264_PSEFL|nr:hypothetical protein PS723_05176 [Pseudomonas fluorescens]